MYADLDEDGNPIADGDEEQLMITEVGVDGRRGGSDAAAGSAGDSKGDSSEAPGSATKSVGGRSAGADGYSETMITKSTPTERKRGEPYAKFCQRITHLNLNGKSLTAIFPFEGMPNIKVLYMYENDIQVMQHLPQSTLTALYLQTNRIRSISGLQSCDNLTKLYLDQNEIARVQGLEGCRHLQELHVASQRLPDGVELTFDDASLRSIASSLRILNISGNRVSSLFPLSGLYALESLDASKNRLETFDDIVPFFETARMLRNVDLRGNPLCEAPKYRDSMIMLADTVEDLDGRKVDKNQREYLFRLAARKQQARRESSSSAGGGAAGGMAAGGAAAPAARGPATKPKLGPSQGVAHRPSQRDVAPAMSDLGIGGKALAAR